MDAELPWLILRMFLSGELANCHIISSPPHPLARIRSAFKNDVNARCGHCRRKVERPRHGQGNYDTRRPLVSEPVATLAARSNPIATTPGAAPPLADRQDCKS